MNLQVKTPQKNNLDQILARQDKERGFELLRLESELLLKRVKDGGYSGQFLADAFVSYYRTNTPFNHSLGSLIRLDYEGIRLFHQILQIRFIPGWTDQALYEIEREIKRITSGESHD